MLHLSPHHLELIKTLKFGVYIRRSTVSEDKQVASLSGQRAELLKVIAKYNLNCNQDFWFEEKKSAFIPGRPGFNQLIKSLKKNKINAVLTWHSNRIARNYGDGGLFVQMMKDGFINLVVTPNGIFEDEPRDREYLMTDFTRATRDSDDKSTDIKRGNRIKLNKGYIPSGRAREGYINCKPDDKSLELTKIQKIDPERFPLLQKAFKLVHDQIKTPMEALTLLNSKWGYRTQDNVELSSSAFYRYLSDPFSYGEIHRKEGIFKASFPPLMSQKEFEKIQVILGNSSSRKRSRKNWPYNGVIKCGNCKSAVITDEKWHIVCTNCNKKFHKAKKRDHCPHCKTLIASMNKPKIRHYKMLYCGRGKNLNDGSRCKQPSISVDSFEKRVDKTLKNIKISDNLKSWGIKWLLKLNSNKGDERKKQLKKLGNLLVINDTNKTKAFKKNLNGTYSDEEFTEAKRLFKEERNGIEKQIEEVKKDSDEWFDMGEKAFKFSRYAQHWFENGDNDQQRMILKTLDTNLKLIDKKLSIHPEKPFILIKKIEDIVQDKIMAHEPNKITDASIFNEVLEDCIPTVMALVDYIRTYFTSSSVLELGLKPSFYIESM